MENNSSTPGKKPGSSWGRYAGLGFQMLAIILIGVFGGIKLDDWIGTKNIFTVVLSLLSIAAAIFLVIKDFIKPRKKK